MLFLLINLVYTTGTRMVKKSTSRLVEKFAEDCIAYRVRVLNRMITNPYDAVSKPLMWPAFP
jgi:hypothetical protein